MRDCKSKREDREGPNQHNLLMQSLKDKKDKQYTGVERESAETELD